MDSEGIVACEVRYCPECGTEIFCKTVPASDLIFYLSEKMDQSIKKCPQCRFDFTGLSVEDLDEAPDRRAKEPPVVRTTAGKKDMVEAIAGAAPEEFSTKAAAERALNAVGDALMEIASSGENIRWPGIGTFKIRRRKARRVRNPQTGEMIDVPAKKAITFVPAKKLREIIELSE